MNPDCRFLTNYNQGLAFLLQLGSELIRVELLSFKHELGAISVGHLISDYHLRQLGRMYIADDYLWLAELYLLCFTLEVMQGTLQNGVQTLTASVYYSGLF